MRNPLRTAVFQVGATVLFLTLPFYFFLWGWLALPWAWASALLLMLAAWFAIRNLCGAFESMAAEDGELGWSRALLVVAAVTAALVLLSGVGGFGFQNYDWNKHNAVLSDLVQQPWPVGYTCYGRPVALVYYVAYYLPAAWAGKAFG